MKLALVPLRHWPWSIHLAAAVLLLGTVSAAGYIAVSHARAERAAVYQELADAKARLQSLRQAQAQPQKPQDFTAQLPPAQRIDDVVRDMGQHAQELGVEVRSIALQPVAGTPQELARIQVSVSAAAEYKAAKAWLGELLARHPTLGVEALTLRASGDAARAELQASLVLFVRD